MHPGGVWYSESRSRTQISAHGSQGCIKGTRIIRGRKTRWTKFFQQIFNFMPDKQYVWYDMIHNFSSKIWIWAPVSLLAAPTEPASDVTTHTSPARPGAGRFTGMADGPPPGSPSGSLVTTSDAGAAPAPAPATVRASSRGRGTSRCWPSDRRGGDPATSTPWWWTSDIISWPCDKGPRALLLSWQRKENKGMKVRMRIIF